MLPGFRILFAITCLSVSVLIFGLGAAAFLRSAHENVASDPWRPIETPATGRVDLAPPTLAMLRVEPEPASPASIDVPVATAAPIGNELPADVPSAAPVADPSPPRTEQAEEPASEEPASAEPVAAATPVPQPAEELPITGPVSPQEAAGDAPVAPVAAEPKSTETTVEETAAAETKEPSSAAPTVAALSEGEATPPMTNADAPATTADAPTPIAPTREVTAETSASAASSSQAAVGTDTLKDDDKAIEGTPAANAAELAEPALANVAPLPRKDVRMPVPRIDPAVLEAQRQRALAQQRSRARGLQVRRLAAARARAAAQAAAAASYPFGVPATTTTSSR